MDDNQSYAQQVHDQTAKLVEIAEKMQQDADTYRNEIDSLDEGDQ